MEPKRLYRSRENRVLCWSVRRNRGIFQRGSGFDPAWNGFVYLRQCGTGLLAYFIASVIMPDQK
mgnify:CR=1 FL=1